MVTVIVAVYGFSALPPPVPPVEVMLAMGSDHGPGVTVPLIMTSVHPLKTPTRWVPDS
jgi:hypothetical protein